AQGLTPGDAPHSSVLHASDLPHFLVFFFFPREAPHSRPVIPLRTFRSHVEEIAAMSWSSFLRRLRGFFSRAPYRHQPAQRIRLACGELETGLVMPGGGRVAAADQFSVVHDHTLPVAPAGVLVNDSGPNGALPAVLVPNSGPEQGAVNFAADG